MKKILTATTSAKVIDEILANGKSVLTPELRAELEEAAGSKSKAAPANEISLQLSPEALAKLEATIAAGQAANLSEAANLLILA